MISEIARGVLKVYGKYASSMPPFAMQMSLHLMCHHHVAMSSIVVKSKEARNQKCKKKCHDEIYAADLSW